MPLASDTTPTWPEAYVDIGPIELAIGHWGVVGLIPYDGHVVLALVTAPPQGRRTRT